MPLVIRRNEGQGFWIDETYRIEVVSTGFRPGWAVLQVTHPERGEKVTIPFKECARVGDVEVCILTTSPFKSAQLVIKTEPGVKIRRDELPRRDT